MGMYIQFLTGNYPGKSRALSHTVLTNGIQAQTSPPPIFHIFLAKVGYQFIPLCCLWRWGSKISFPSRRGDSHTASAGWSRSALLGTTLPEMMSDTRWWKPSTPPAPEKGWNGLRAIPSHLAPFRLTAGWGRGSACRSPGDFRDGEGGMLTGSNSHHLFSLVDAGMRVQLLTGSC